MSGHSQPDFTLEHVFVNLTELPTFPKVVHRALSLLDDPNATMPEVAEILKYDPSLTANILRITNSAHFGLSRQVTGLETALALLGQNQIREILTASASMPYLQRSLQGYDMEPSDLWEHSIGAALTAEVVAEYRGYNDPALAFTAALLHDIGKIVMNIHVGGRIDEILAVANQERLTFAEAEWRVLGGDHAVIGYEILRQWEFPPIMSRAVRSHHDPDLYVQDELSALLALSNILTVQLGIGVGADGFRYNISPRLMERLKLSRTDIHRCMKRALSAYRKAGDILALYQAAGDGGVQDPGGR